ncbi:Di-sulfide bridge nucleocytoplasmic transport domain-containing protein [Myxozyma melibiosi]|uniref:Di-sulfide bridge nucleocytoplasmic transport domain-containing protein n=1 Tax=Myxozyma melibiosi TaxID=54550 RepID=A0ABR1F1R0_9ASCO
MMEMDYSPAQRSTYRGSESPMDFSYSGSAHVDSNSPFKVAGSFPTPSRATPGAYNGFVSSVTPHHQQSQQSPFTPFFTANTNESRARPGAFGEPMTSPTGNRGNQIRSEEVLPAGSPMDEDVVMLSAGTTPTPTPRAGQGDQTTSNREEDKENNMSFSRKFMKAMRRSSSGTSPISKLFSKRLSPPKQSGRRRQYNQNSDYEEDDDDLFDDSDDSEWSDRVVVKKTTVMRSPRKGSSSIRSGSPRKVSRTVSSHAVVASNHQQNPSLLAALSSHDNLPFVFAQYLQLMFNVFLVLVMLYLIMTFVLMVRGEVRHKVEEYTQKAAIEIALCTSNYIENHCADIRTQFNAAACSSWQKCMDREPSDVGRASVSAETVADILNSFIERLSYKSMGFLFVLILGSIYVSSTKGFQQTHQTVNPPPHLQERIAYHQPPPSPKKMDFSRAIEPINVDD